MTIGVTKNKMTAKKYLEQVRYLELEIKSKEREIKKLKLDAQGLKSQRLCDRVATSCPDNYATAIIDKAIDLENTINAEIQEKLTLKKEVRGQLLQLQEARHRVVLIDYYITCCTLEEIAENIGYSVAQTKRLCKAGILDFEKNIFQNLDTK